MALDRFYVLYFEKERNAQFFVATGTNKKNCGKSS